MINRKLPLSLQKNTPNSSKTNLDIQINSSSKVNRDKSLGM